MTPELRRTLRDIHDGHLTLYVQTARYNPATGQPVEPHEIRTTSDRAPAIPSPCDDWWRHLAADGWLRLPREDEPQIWRLTDIAIEALQ